MGFFDTLFSQADTSESSEINEHQRQLITATLLIEVSKADFDQDDVELNHISQLLKSHFSLSQTEVSTLISLAQQHSDKVTSLQHLTRELNETLTQQDKITIIEMMWQVVYADGEKDHYEEYLMRQVADLLYVSHEHFIKARFKAEST